MLARAKQHSTAQHSTRSKHRANRSFLPYRAGTHWRDSNDDGVRRRVQGPVTAGKCAEWRGCRGSTRMEATSRRASIVASRDASSTTPTPTTSNNNACTNIIDAHSAEFTEPAHSPSHSHSVDAPPHCSGRKNTQHGYGSAHSTAAPTPTFFVK